MKTYTFPWQYDEAWGEIDLDLSEEEVEMIKSAYRDAFDYLEQVDDLNSILERALEQLDFYDPDEEQDIRIYFPEEITAEVDEEE